MENGRRRENTLWRTLIANTACSRAILYEHKVCYEVWCDDVGWALKGKTGSVVETCYKGVWELIPRRKRRRKFQTRLMWLGDATGLDHQVHVVTKYQRKLGRAYVDLTKHIHKANRAILSRRKDVVYRSLATWNVRKGDVTILLGRKTLYLLQFTACIF